MNKFELPVWQNLVPLRSGESDRRRNESR